VKRRILLATRNRNKVREFQQILGDAVEFLPLPPEVPEVEEDGLTFEENARKKARGYAVSAHLPTIAEDSGLEVDALDGAPGVYSARFAGDGAGDEANNCLLMDRLSGVSGAGRGARFVCCMVYRHEGIEEVFEGEIRGRIAEVPRGSTGFGYDPLFIPEGHDRTFAEMPAGEKNAMSHRYNAIMKLAGRLVGDKPRS